MNQTQKAIAEIIAQKPIFGNVNKTKGWKECSEYFAVEIADFFEKEDKDSVFEQLSKEMAVFAQNNHQSYDKLKDFFAYELYLRCVSRHSLNLPTIEPKEGQIKVGFDRKEFLRACGVQ